MWILIFTLLFQDPSLISTKSFHKQASALIDQPSFHDGFHAFSVYAPLRGERLFERHVDKNFRPASNLKILTALSAMTILGPDFHFQTTTAYQGEINDLVLFGNLMVIADGDPSLASRYFGRIPDWRLREILAAARIHGVIGDLLIVADQGEDRFPPSWEWDDLGRSYASPLSDFYLSDNRYEWWLEEEINGDRLLYPTFQTEVRPLLVEGEADGVDWDPGLFKENPRLNFGQGACLFMSLEMSPWDLDRFFKDILVTGLPWYQFHLEGKVRMEAMIPEGELVVLDQHDSPTLDVLLSTMMRLSLNHYAEAIALKTGEVVMETRSLEAATTVNKAFLEEVCRRYGVTAAGAQLRDSSGLSAQNYLQPQQIEALLRFGWDSDFRGNWLYTFPVLGEDGTLQSRGVAQGAAIGRVFAKTGYINRCRTLSGYAFTTSGEPLIFVMMSNGYGSETKAINALQDQLCELMVRIKPSREVRRLLKAQGEGFLPGTNLDEGRK